MRAECRSEKTLGEPDVGNLQVRFDEGALETGLRSGLNGHEAGNGGYSQDLAYGVPRQRPTLLGTSKTAVEAGCVFRRFQPLIPVEGTSGESTFRLKPADPRPPESASGRRPETAG